jgi:hypothetical protein
MQFGTTELGTLASTGKACMQGVGTTLGTDAGVGEPGLHPGGGAFREGGIPLVSKPTAASTTGKARENYAPNLARRHAGNRSR